MYHMQHVTVVTLLRASHDGSAWRTGNNAKVIILHTLERNCSRPVTFHVSCTRRRNESATLHLRMAD